MSREKISGIYKITNKVNGKYYIGSSDNIFGYSGRWKEHINSLKSNRHDNSYLQRSWNKYGITNFEFSVLEEVPKERLFEVEQKYLDKSKLDGKTCYNLSFLAIGGGHTGHLHSAETKRQISNKLKGRVSPMKGRKISIEDNKHVDQTIYKFTNIHTNDTFMGRRYDFCVKYNIGRSSIDNLIQGKSKTSHGWIYVVN